MSLSYEWKSNLAKELVNNSSEDIILCLQGIHNLIFYDTSQVVFVSNLVLISNLNIISPLVLIIYLFNHQILFFHFNSL